ncbi:carboxymuconolactone decarboxylase family protein [Catenulispora subtropica]|uniref:Carboxymuconolactone decarboxylase family protein n=1 Tax=Catenulispora subtropica TaxID=450798 RepID=A0ABP5C800_9ACTN
METRINLMETAIGSKVGKRFYATSTAVAESSLPKSLQDLLSLRISQINGCGFCVDIHTKDAVAAGETDLRLHLVAAWKHTTVFTEAERAALALAEEGTRITVPGEVVSDATWEQARKHFDDEQLAALTCLIALMNASNRMALILNTPGGSYAPGAFAALD